MASSVSSERAFSSAGLTITKLRNRLQGDIVEALQVLKCTLRSELIIREPPPSSVLQEQILSADIEAATEATGERDNGDGSIDLVINLDSDCEEDGTASARLHLPKPNFSVYSGLGTLLALYP